VDVRCDTGTVTLGEVVRTVLKRVYVNPGDGVNANEDGDGDENEEDEGDLPEVSIYEDKRILADPDFDDNLDKTLDEIGCEKGKFVTVVDEEGEWGVVAIAISDLPYVSSFLNSSFSFSFSFRLLQTNPSFGRPPPHPPLSPTHRPSQSASLHT